MCIAPCRSPSSTSWNPIAAIRTSCRERSTKRRQYEFVGEQHENKMVQIQDSNTIIVDRRAYMRFPRQILGIFSWRTSCPVRLDLDHQVEVYLPCLSLQDQRQLRRSDQKQRERSEWEVKIGGKLSRTDEAAGSDMDYLDDMNMM